MSKPIVRVTFFVLISLVLIAATSVSVRGWLEGTREAAGVQVHNVDGLQTNLNHDRSTISELETLQTQTQSGQGQGHEGGCHSESQTSNDY